MNTEQVKEFRDKAWNLRLLPDSFSELRKDGVFFVSFHHGETKKEGLEYSKKVISLAKEIDPTCQCSVICDKMSPFDPSKKTCYWFTKIFIT